MLIKPLGQFGFEPLTLLRG